MENKWHEMFFDFSSTPDDRVQVWHVILRLSTWFQNMVNIHLKYVTLKSTYAFNGLVIFLPDGLPVFINGHGVLFLSYYMLVILIDLHKQLLFAAGKDPAQSFSGI